MLKDQIKHSAKFLADRRYTSKDELFYDLLSAYDDVEAIKVVLNNGLASAEDMAR